MHKRQPCLADLIRTGKNSCHGTFIHLAETSTCQINSKEVLVIPAAPTNVKSFCDIEGIYEISKPCIISLGRCKISINGKYFEAEQTTHEEFVFELPTFEMPRSTNFKTEKTFHLKQMDIENLKQIKTIANNLQTTDLHISHTRSHPWVNTSIILIAIASTLVILYYVKIYYPRRQRRQESQIRSQKIEEPLFSSLGREELCS